MYKWDEWIVCVVRNKINGEEEIEYFEYYDPIAISVYEAGFWIGRKYFYDASFLILNEDKIESKSYEVTFFIEQSGGRRKLTDEEFEIFNEGVFEGQKV